jgi:hypothetical protein
MVSHLPLYLLVSVVVDDGAHEYMCEEGWKIWLLATYFYLDEHFGGKRMQMVEVRSERIKENRETRR